MDSRPGTNEGSRYTQEGSRPGSRPSGSGAKESGEEGEDEDLFPPEPLPGPVLEFLEICSKYGHGSTLRGWRKYFDFAIQGGISFAEFCKGLAAVNYDGDAVQFWNELDEDKSNRLDLEEAMPAEDAAVQEFKELVTESGGCWAFWELLDTEGKLEATYDEFASRLVGMGFQADATLLPPGLDLDQHKVVNPEDLFFLEEDGKIRTALKKKIKKLRKERLNKLYGLVDDVPPSEAAQLVYGLRRKMGILSGKDWTCSKFAYAVDTNRPEPPEERPEWIVNLERAGSLAVEAASDGWYLDTAQWESQMQASLKAIEAQEKLLPKKREKVPKPELPPYEAVAHKRHLKKRPPLKPPRKHKLAPPEPPPRRPHPVELYGPQPFRLPEIGNGSRGSSMQQSSIFKSRSMPSMFSSSMLSSGGPQKLLTCPTQEAFMQYYAMEPERPKPKGALAGSGSARASFSGAAALADAKSDVSSVYGAEKDDSSQ